ncbi:hypothetical protein Tsubulata_042271 [Turnera subulata]|uniref:F-box domain-containing protein n=1 Tax=Turnera subulata TaxID=218843 RepID=A0A9Q0GAG8_9ROSI|nr:hypothetical protein Tsubulata_042271 [Turnera subulata]
MAAVDPQPIKINRLALSLLKCLGQFKSATSISTATSTPTATATATSSLSDLPDDVLLHILGFLPSIKEAIQASLISRRWRNLWLRLPQLLFPATHNRRLWDMDRKSALFIHRALALRPPQSPQLHKFYLHHVCGYQDGGYQNSRPYQESLQRKRDLESWISYAINNQSDALVLLELHFSTYNCFEFPAALTNANVVKSLKITLCECRLLGRLSLGSARIKSLTSLSLEKITFGNYRADEILSLFDNLISFSFEDSFLQDNSVVKIHSLKLKELNLGFIRCSGSLEIECPNLTSLVMNY